MPIYKINPTLLLNTRISFCIDQKFIFQFKFALLFRVTFKSYNFWDSCAYMPLSNTNERTLHFPLSL